MAIPLLAAAALPSVIQGVSGIIQQDRGKKMASNNPFITESVNENIAKNAALAEQAAQVGLPQEQYNKQQEAINRNQATGIRLASRNTRPTGISSIVRATNDAMGNLNAQDAMARQQNQRLAMQQRGALAQEQNRVWDWNNRQRYLQNARAASETIGAGRRNLFGGIQGLSQLGQLALGGGQGFQLGQGYLNNQLQNSLLTGQGMNPFVPNV